MTNSTLCRRWVWAIMLTLTLSVAVSAAMPGSITSFGSAITVNDDGSLSVQEDVQYQPDANYPVTGFYRYLPNNFTARKGLRRLTPITLTADATCNQLPIQVRQYKKKYGLLLDFSGGAIAAQQQQTANNYNYGSTQQNSSLPPPPPDEFKYSYRVDRLVDYQPKREEIIWHVTGDGWELPLQSCTVTVALPKNIDPGTVNVTGLIGHNGETVEVTRDLTTGLFTAHVLRVLQTGEGLTLTLDFPPNALPHPNPGTKRAWLWQANPTMYHTPIVLGILFLAYLIMWVIVGRDPQHGRVTATALPPEKISPALAHYLRKERYDPEVLMCALVNMAARGFLWIEEDEDRYVFHLVTDENFTTFDAKMQSLRGDPEHALSAEEVGLATILFSNTRKDFEFSENNAEAIQQMETYLEGKLRKRTEQTLLNQNSAFFGVGLGIGALLLIYLVIGEVPAVAWFERLRLWLGVLTMSIGVPLIAIKGWHLWQDVFSYRVGRAGNTMIILRSIGIGLAVLLVGWFGMAPASGLLWLAVLVFIGLHILYAHLLKAPTLHGQRLLDQLEGFRAYLGGATPGGAPIETPELFVRCLPYALALEVQDRWAERFQNRFDHQQLAEAIDWYDGESWDGQNLILLSHSLHAEMAPSMTPITVPVD